MTTTTPHAGLCIAGTVPPGNSTITRCSHPGGHTGPHSWDHDEDDDQEPPSLYYPHAGLGVAIGVLGTALDDLHAVRRGARPEAQEQLDLAIERTQAAWASATFARAAVRDVTL